MVVIGCSVIGTSIAYALGSHGVARVILWQSLTDWERFPAAS